MYKYLQLWNSTYFSTNFSYGDLVTLFISCNSSLVSRLIVHHDQFASRPLHRSRQCQSHFLVPRGKNLHPCRGRALPTPVISCVLYQVHQPLVEVLVVFEIKLEQNLPVRDSEGIVARIFYSCVSVDRNDEVRAPRALQLPVGSE